MSSPSNDDERIAIQREVTSAASELSREFDRDVPVSEVHRAVRESFDRLADSPIKTFVPILARRDARDRLRGFRRGPGTSGR